jgi:hypothetical protein
MRVLTDDVSAKKSPETNGNLVWQMVVMVLLGVSRWSSIGGETDAGLMI